MVFILSKVHEHVQFLCLQRFKRFSCEIHKKEIFWNILELLQHTSVLIQSDKSGQNWAKRKPAMAAPHQAARYLSSCRFDDQCRLRGHVINQILYIWLLAFFAFLSFVLPPPGGLLPLFAAFPYTCFLLSKAYLHATEGMAITFVTGSRVED